MASFLNIKYLENKNLFMSLQSCYGLSDRSIFCLIAILGVNLRIFYNQIPFFIKTHLDFYLNLLLDKEFKFRIGKALIHYDEILLSKLYNLKILRSIRHKQCLPVRGQRTHTNAKTQKNKLKNRLKILKVKFKKK